MLPGRIERADRVLAAPPDWNEQTHSCCASLPIRVELVRGVPCMTSAWLPTAEELQALIAGAAVHLHVFNTSHPVVGVSVGSPPEGE